eukprot:TRINITY_DN3412_c0_g1_i3.p1 TRINITY_DN3412_c0_g1~~TRINITY_DN3412_c0_g1_i3.p1  ORF type:complete len:361 (+),score=109.29 TRINITY_DN3412_c0_g1_i3:165-1247(+)
MDVDSNTTNSNSTSTNNGNDKENKENQTVNQPLDLGGPVIKKKKFTIPSFKDVEEVRGAKIDALSLFEKRKEATTIANTTTTTITSTTNNTNNNTTPKQIPQPNNFTSPSPANVTPPQTNTSYTPSSSSSQKSTPSVTRSPYFSSSSKPSPNNNTTPSPSDNTNNNNSSGDSQDNSPPARSLSFGEAFSFIQSDPTYSPPAPSLPQTPISTSPLPSHSPNVNNRPSPNIARASPFTPTRSARSIIIHQNQRKNPMLKHVKNVPFEVGNIIPDYVLGETTCALFLSLKYHNLHPTYILDRIKEIHGMYKLRILLVLVDIEDVVVPVQVSLSPFPYLLTISFSLLVNPSFLPFFLSSLFYLY